MQQVLIEYAHASDLFQPKLVAKPDLTLRNILASYTTVASNPTLRYRAYVN